MKFTGYNLYYIHYKKSNTTIVDSPNIVVRDTQYWS